MIFSNKLQLHIAVPGFGSFKQIVHNVGKTIINHPFGNGLCHLFMVIWRMVYCFTHINQILRRSKTLTLPRRCSEVTSAMMPLATGRNDASRAPGGRCTEHSQRPRNHGRDHHSGLEASSYPPSSAAKILLKPLIVHRILRIF